MCEFKNLDFRYQNIIIMTLRDLSKYGIDIDNMYKKIENTKFRIIEKMSKEDEKKGIAAYCKPNLKITKNHIEYDGYEIVCQTEDILDMKIAHEILHLLAIKDLKKEEDKYLVEKGMQSFYIDKEGNIVTDTAEIIINSCIDEAMTEIIREGLNNEKYSKFTLNMYILYIKVMKIILKLLYGKDYLESAIKIYFEDSEKLYKDLRKDLYFYKSNVMELYRDLYVITYNGLTSPISVMKIVYDIIPKINQIIDYAISVKNMKEEDVFKLLNIESRDDLIKILYYDIVNLYKNENAHQS